MMCICVLRFTLHYINFRWSCKFVYSPLSFHYKCIVIHSTVSNLVRVKEQIKLCKSMGCLRYNFIICDHHHMRPLIQYTITLHGDPDQGLQPAEEGGKLIHVHSSFLQGITVLCLSRGRLFDFSDSCEH